MAAHSLALPRTDSQPTAHSSFQNSVHACGVCVTVRPCVWTLVRSSSFVCFALSPPIMSWFGGGNQNMVNAAPRASSSTRASCTDSYDRRGCNSCTRPSPQEKQLFNLKFTSKQLNRMQAKCAKQEKDEVLSSPPIRTPSCPNCHHPTRLAGVRSSSRSRRRWRRATRRRRGSTPRTPSE